MNKRIAKAVRQRALDVVQRIIDSRPLRLKILEAASHSGTPLTEQAISEWRHLKKGVPPSRAQLVSEVMGLSLHEVRGDIFPPSP